jgi:two-component system, NarL family, sensor kinase
MERLKLEEQKKLLQAGITAQENERERIARDLHDEIGALLSTVKLFLTAGQTLPTAPKPAGNRAEELLDEAILKLRAIAQNLMPENLKLFGLVSAIERACQQVESTGVFAVQFQHKLELRLSRENEIHVYRIVQELLNNAIKHAKASQVTLMLYRRQNQIVLNYEDNGVGFVSSTTTDKISLGLASLSGRVQMLQGEMSLKSTPGNGVQVQINFPIIDT